MSYYKGGRGSGGYRGSSYRGSRGGGDTWRGSRGGGNSFSSSSRGNRYSYPSPTYDSRSRSSYQGGGADRYSRGNRDEPYHRYSQDVSSYSARDYTRALSPEPPRKRARPESSPTYLGPRRSHERSFTSDYSSSRSYYDKGGASSSGGGGYLGDKVYTREVRERGSEFGFRKPAPRGGGYRGRTRGFRSTSFLRKRDSFAIRKRAALSSRSDYIRRLKQLRLRRRFKAVRRQQKGSDDDDDVDDDDLDLDQEEKDLAEEEGSGVEEEEEEEEEEEVGSSGQEEGDENEENEGQGEKDEDQEGEGTVKKEENAGEEGEKKEGDEEEKKNEEKVTKKKVVKKVKKKAVKVKSEKEEVKTEDGEKDGEDKDKDEGDEGGEKQPLTDFLGQPFIKLKCPHCHHICITFKEYSKHLDTRKHQLSMQDLFTKLRKILSGMRMEQRKKQRILDEECKAKNMRLRTFFCSICKLNYRTLKSHHQASSSHRKISEFLLPFCKVCRMWFKSAWSYEVHLCELSHIKKKARLEKLSRPPAGKDDSLLADREENDMLDTSSFMVLDSVGSGDDSDAEKSEDAEEKKEGEETEEKTDKDTDKKKKKKSEIKLGAEHCKLVQVYYCDLCKIYLPRLDDKERALTIHCRSRTHLQRYVRINSRKNDENLRRKAVRLHKEKQKLKEKEKKKEETTPKEEETAGSVEAEAKSEGKEEVKEPEEEGKESEEKTWNEVDKDLSDLLHEGEDEEETPKERYDRFRKSGETEVNGTDPAPDN